MRGCDGTSTRNAFAGPHLGSGVGRDAIATGIGPISEGALFLSGTLLSVRCFRYPLTCEPALGWQHQTPKHFVLPLCIDRSLSYGPVIYRQESSMAKPTDLVQGTLDLLMLKTLALQPMHGWGIAQRIRQVSKDVLQVNQGALYPALHRLEQQGWIRAKWGEPENNRRAKITGTLIDLQDILGNLTDALGD